MQIDINSLNPQQREAVITTDGPLLILAGAGSGKTRVLTVRIAYILEQKLAHPEEILAVTFTNKAAKEMKERIAHLLGTQIGLPWMGTFHSICLKILKRDGHNLGLSPNFTIYDPNDQQTLVKQAMDALNISIKEVNPKAVLGYISTAKNELISDIEYPNFAQGYFQELVAKIYPAYQKLLRENNAVDFDDLLLKVVELFKKFPEVLKKYRSLFKYILVDEYQDTNHVQYEMISLLAREHLNICVVGDDDQSIYAFRGATIRNILNFERDYPRAKIIKLEQNYRSTKRILDAAYEVVRKNQKRTDKKLWTDNKVGEAITIYTATDEKDEAEWVAQQIQALTMNGIDLEEVAVLYRTNAQSRALEERFIRTALSYRIVGGVRFYDRKEVKDLLSYLRMLYNPQDDTSLKRIINVPPRGIGPKAGEDLARLSQAKGMSCARTLVEFASELDSKPLQKFATLLREIVNMSGELNVADLINFVLEKTGYIEMLEDGTSENEARIENLKELISVAAKFYDLTPKDGLEAFLEEVSLLEGDAGTEEENAPKVTLMTIHAAKGLEFQHVFVVGMEEGLFPHSRVFTDPSELEEERRLAYVAITRAKEHLYLVHADSRMYFGARQQNMVSRFVEDIPEKLVERTGRSGERRSGWEDVSDSDWSEDIQIVEVKSGDRVKHEYFGVGKVISVNDSTVKVNFGPVYGTKELSREFAPLQKV